MNNKPFLLILFGYLPSITKGVEQMLNTVKTDGFQTVTTPQFKNIILSGLPETEYREIAPDLQLVEMKSHDVINRPYEHVQYVYFPETSMVSSVKILEDGASVETGSIGREGVTGISVALSKRPSPKLSIVQIPGEGYRMKSDKFRAALKRNGLLSDLVSEFIFTNFTETAQCVACNSHHTVTERLAKWLLISQCKTGRKELELTQDFIAQMLGIHRPGVTLAALQLKNAGLIDYRRGLVRITDKEGLEEFACECYETLKSGYPCN
ncbi:MAG TPA: Crp/Fnr family transcriptional regulator [Pyrinomonadaceae bacterium]